MISSSLVASASWRFQFAENELPRKQVRSEGFLE